MMTIFISCLSFMLTLWYNLFHILSDNHVRLITENLKLVKAEVTSCCLKSCNFHISASYRGSTVECLRTHGGLTRSSVAECTVITKSCYVGRYSELHITRLHNCNRVLTSIKNSPTNHDFVRLKTVNNMIIYRMCT